MRNRVFVEIKKSKMIAVVGMFALLAIVGSINPIKASNEDNSQHIRFLKERSDYYALKNVKPDSSLYYNLQLISFLDKLKNLSTEERDILVTACNNTSYLYSTHFSDYPEAVKCLLKAQKYCENPLQKLTIDINKGLIYSIYAECFPTEENIKAAQSLFLQTFHDAIAQGNTGIAAAAFLNFWNFGFNDDYLNKYSKEIEQFSQLQFPQNDVYAKFYHTFSRVVRSMKQHDYIAALKHMRLQKQLIPDTEAAKRLESVVNWEMAVAFHRTNQPDSMFHYAMRVMQLGKEEDMKDVKMSATRLMMDYYRDYGTEPELDEQHLQFYLLRDTLLNFHNLSSVKNYPLLSDINQLTQQVSNLNRIRRLQNFVIILAVIGILLVVGLLLALFKKNKILTERNKLLYKQAQSMITELKPKYVKSNMTDAKKRELAEKIEYALNNNKEIYNDSFNLERLAAITDSHYKEVSQVVNELFGKNFTLLLSEYRIKEACRRLNDKEHYGHLTFEALGNSVGFKARTGFNNAFKRVTGLTPTEYLKIQKSEQSKAQ